MCACYVCMYVTLCIYIHTIIYTCIHMHAFIHTYAYIHACIRSVLDVLERFGSTRFAGLAIKVYSRDGGLHWSMQHDMLLEFSVCVCVHVYICMGIYMHLYISATVPWRNGRARSACLMLPGAGLEGGLNCL